MGDIRIPFFLIQAVIESWLRSSSKYCRLPCHIFTRFSRRRHMRQHRPFHFRNNDLVLLISIVSMRVTLRLNMFGAATLFFSDATFSLELSLLGGTTGPVFRL